jgi:hypothetical protein
MGKEHETILSGEAAGHEQARVPGGKYRHPRLYSLRARAASRCANQPRSRERVLNPRARRVACC